MAENTNESELWRRGFARQARSDWAIYELLLRQPKVAACHLLHYLQMCLEKTAKAHLWQTEKQFQRPADLMTSHKVIQKVMPEIFKNYWMTHNPGKPVPKWKLTQIRHLCQEIDFLAPSVDADGRRPDNCEYPWIVSDQKSNRLLVPCEYSFPIQELLNRPEGVELLKCIRVILDEILH